MILSNSQITKLGDRLRNGEVDKEDLKMLDEFRETFSDIDKQIYPMIQNTLSTRTDSTLTKRKRKTQQSIVDKLCRQPNLRLPQMQDIAGCRIVVEGGSQTIQQIDSLLANEFASEKWQIESKNRHAHGYRAIHIIVKIDNKFYEIQLRTYAQDIWANLVERLCDEKNTLKYGGTKQEEELMKTLKKLADNFDTIDQQAHELSLERYKKNIEEAIKNVLSN